MNHIAWTIGIHAKCLIAAIAFGYWQADWRAGVFAYFMIGTLNHINLPPEVK